MKSLQTIMLKSNIPIQRVILLMLWRILQMSLTSRVFTVQLLPHEPTFKLVFFINFLYLTHTFFFCIQHTNYIILFPISFFKHVYLNSNMFE